jgi:hypothetical protein
MRSPHNSTLPFPHYSRTHMHNFLRASQLAMHIVE